MRTKDYGDLITEHQSRWGINGRTKRRNRQTQSHRDSNILGMIQRTDTKKKKKLILRTDTKGMWVLSKDERHEHYSQPT